MLIDYNDIPNVIPSERRSRDEESPSINLVIPHPLWGIRDDKEPITSNRSPPT